MIHYCKGEYSREGVMLDPSAPAFRYGAGFFETIYYNGHMVCHLDLHLDRLLYALRAHTIEFETVDFDAIVHQVINRNGLRGKPARVNIFYPIETPTAYPVVLAVPHEPKPYKAYRLCICNDKHISTLNAHKTTSYMFFHLALKQAQARGFDDTVLTDFDDTLLESTTGSILLEKDGAFFSMNSPYRLHSTTLDLAASILEIMPRAITLKELPEYDHAYLLNTMIGMRPIVAIGETAFVPNEEPCRDVTELTLGDEL